MRSIRLGSANGGYAAGLSRDAIGRLFFSETHIPRSMRAFRPLGIT